MFIDTSIMFALRTKVPACSFRWGKQRHWRWGGGKEGMSRAAMAMFSLVPFVLWICFEHLEFTMCAFHVQISKREWTCAWWGYILFSNRKIRKPHIREHDDSYLNHIVAFTKDVWLLNAGINHKGRLFDILIILEVITLC